MKRLTMKFEVVSSIACIVIPVDGNGNEIKQKTEK